jgi:outer membrane protein
MYKNLIFIFTQFFLYCAFLYSQSIQESLSLVQAIELAKNNNLSLKQQEERIQQARRALNIQKTGLFPKISAQGAYSYTSELAKLLIPNTPINIKAGFNNLYDVNVNLQQTIFTGFRTLNLVKSATADVNSSKSQQLILTNQLILQIQDIYYTAQLNQLQQQILKNSMERSQKDLRSVQNFYNAGQMSAFDTLRVANQLLTIQTELNEIKHQFKIILTQLAFILNIDEIKRVESFTGGNNIFTLMPVEDYIELALNHRPEMSNINEQTTAQKYRKRSVTAAFYPQIMGQLSYHYAKPGVNFFENEWMDYYTIGISLQWEIWNMGRRRQESKLADHALNILEIERAKTIEHIKKELRETYENLLSDRDQILLTERLVQQERERYRITREKYDQGLVTTLDLTETESALTNAELRHKQSKVNWEKNQAFLRYATGLPFTEN